MSSVHDSFQEEFRDFSSPHPLFSCCLLAQMLAIQLLSKIYNIKCLVFPHRPILFIHYGEKEEEKSHIKDLVCSDGERNLNNISRHRCHTESSKLAAHFLITVKKEIIVLITHSSLVLIPLTLRNKIRLQYIIRITNKLLLIVNDFFFWHLNFPSDLLHFPVKTYASVCLIPFNPFPLWSSWF